MRWFLSCLLLPALGVRAALDLHNLVYSIGCNLCLANLWNRLVRGRRTALDLHNLVNSVWVNWLLAVFNMLPQPRLDGGRGLYQI